MIARKTFIVPFLFSLLVGWGGAPIRPALEEDIRIPSGKIEGNQITGIRYPFNVSVPSNWRMTTEFPDFLQGPGYDKPSLMEKEGANDRYMKEILESFEVLDK